MQAPASNPVPGCYVVYYTTHARVTTTLAFGTLVQALRAARAIKTRPALNCYAAHVYNPYNGYVGSYYR